MAAVRPTSTPLLVMLNACVVAAAVTSAELPPHPSAYTYMLRVANAECGGQSLNLGHQQTPAICAFAAGRAGCDSFMHSSAYPGWGCRCCSRADGGNAHNLWSVYNVRNCNAPGVACKLPSDVLAESMRAAEAFCSDGNAAANADVYFTAAQDAHDVASNREAHDAIDPNFAGSLLAAASSAAAVLSRFASGGCLSVPSACNHGAILYHQLRSLLLLTDAHAERAFVDSPERARLFDAHRVAIADALYLDRTSVSAVHAFFDALPPHLMHNGVLHDAPFATMTVRDAFKCGADGSAGALLHYTPRGFNVGSQEIEPQTTPSELNSTAVV